MVNNGMVGRFVKTSNPKKAAATPKASGREKICFKNSAGKSCFCVLRVTSKPAANEIKNAGTWLTKAVADRQFGEDFTRLRES